MTRTAQERRRAPSPWGPIESTETIADGITFISTASHGGIRLSQWRHEIVLRAIPAWETFAGGRWYEEDCDWAVVALIFPEKFPTKTKDARTMVRALAKLPRWQAVADWIDAFDTATARMATGIARMSRPVS